jgi:hypothetical protein
MGSGSERIFNIITIVFLLLSACFVVFVIMRLVGG